MITTLAVQIACSQDGRNAGLQKGGYSEVLSWRFYSMTYRSIVWQDYYVNTTTNEAEVSLTWTSNPLRGWAASDMHLVNHRRYLVRVGSDVTFWELL